MIRSRRSRKLRHAYEATVAGNPNRRRDIGLWAGHFGDPVLALDAMRAAIDEQGGQMRLRLASAARADAPAAGVQDVHARHRHGRVLAGIRLAGRSAEPLDEHDFECN